jgi:hypothetical protein
VSEMKAWAIWKAEGEKRAGAYGKVAISSISAVSGRRGELSPAQQNCSSASSLPPSGTPAASRSRVDLTPVCPSTIMRVEDEWFFRPRGIAVLWNRV